MNALEKNIGEISKNAESAKKVACNASSKADISSKLYIKIEKCATTETLSKLEEQVNQLENNLWLIGREIDPTLLSEPPPSVDASNMLQTQPYHILKEVQSLSTLWIKGSFRWI